MKNCVLQVEIRSNSVFYSFNKRFILPRLILTVKIVIKSLPANFKSLAVKVDFSLDSVVIRLEHYEFQALYFPDFRRLAAKKAEASSRNSFSSSNSRFFFSSSFMRLFAACSCYAILSVSSGVRVPFPVSVSPALALLSHVPNVPFGIPGSSAAALFLRGSTL